MKLEIIIPHYTEDPHLMMPMFNILKIQRNVDFKDFRVLIVNDGMDIHVPDDLIHGWPFEVKQINIEHGGISRARNEGLRAASADWVMFCDSDDAFLTTVSLQLFLKYTDRKDIGLVSSGFFEEALQDDGTMVVLRHDGKDNIFVHGKMFKREWLLKNNIHFCGRLQLHEDSFFVAMANFMLGKKEKINLQEHLYLWQWNKKSVTRAEGHDFTLRTYGHLCIKNAALADELFRRGMGEHAKRLILHSITNGYNNMHRKDWNTEENIGYAQKAERDLASFFHRYEKIFYSLPKDEVEWAIEGNRDWLISRGEIDKEAEFPTIWEWTDKLRDEIEPTPLEYVDNPMEM